MSVKFEFPVQTLKNIQSVQFEFPVQTPKNIWSKTNLGNLFSLCHNNNV